VNITPDVTSVPFNVALSSASSLKSNLKGSDDGVKHSLTFPPFGNLNN
jgi:hypothetical protein